MEPPRPNMSAQPDQTENASAHCANCGYFLLAGRREYSESWQSLALKFIALLLVQFVLISVTLALIYFGYLRGALA